MAEVVVKPERNFTDDSGTTVEAMMDAIADRYFKVDYAIFTPNQDRLDHITEMARHFKADGIIHYNGSHNLNQWLRDKNN